MKILPYDTFTILTCDPLHIVLQRLNAKVEAKKIFRFSTEHAPYEGKISEEGFQISRIIHYRNSFLPVIQGRFEIQNKQTLIHIQMKINPFVVSFLGFYFLLWYSAVIPAILMIGTMPTHMAVTLVVMPILMLIICYAAFWLEANRSRTELSQIIQGQL